MEQTTQYRQLQPEDRMTMAMASMKQQGLSARAMARALSRSPSAITRELARNILTAMPYGSHTAQVASFSRRVAARPAAKLAFDGVGWGVVRTLLDWKWSPQQIAATLKRVFPDDPDRHVSHETNYTAIYAQPRGELRKQLVAFLRHGRGTRLPRTRGEDRRGQISDMVSIHVRPPEVKDRVMPGHWKGNFIKGVGNKSSLGVLVERTSRLVLLAKMDDATAASALAGFSAKMNSIAAPLRKSVNYDQGKEMSRHVDLAAQTVMKVHSCDSHSPWQRGTCENTNGLVRQYLPKGNDLSVFSQAELDGIADSLEIKPRATHDWHTPLDVFAQTLANSHDPSTSVH